MQRVRIATAGWSIPRAVAAGFPAEGSGLARYAARLDATEINSTFYRPSRPSTLARWAQTVSPDFRFAVKIPKAISHEARLVGTEPLVDAFLAQVAGLGKAAGPLLLQLPPSLAFDDDVAGPVMHQLQSSGHALVCEPRDVSWFTPDVDQWLADRRVARVAADPARHPGADEPGGWRGLTYHRLHGSPRTYYSSYGDAAITALAARIQADAADETWCVFDNTASGAALADARRLQAALESG